MILSFRMVVFPESDDLCGGIPQYLHSWVLMSYVAIVRSSNVNLALNVVSL